MSKTDDGNQLPKWRVNLRKSANPYAAHYYGPKDPGLPQTAKELYRISENPYAHDYYLGSELHDPASASLPRSSLPPSTRRSISKADFELGCRTIFRRYMPEAERSKLRPHHQDFIRRNAATSPERRYALLQELRRYDLSTEPGLRTYFNREEDAFTEAKLKNIEESVKQD